MYYLEKLMNFVVRRAENADIPFLAEICRNSFYDRSMWQAPQFRAKRIWKNILSWNNNETWVCSFDDRVSGFVTLVTNPVSFQQGWNRLKKDFWLVILSIILSFRYVRIIAGRKILAYYHRYKKHKSGINIFQQAKENCLLLYLLAVDPKIRKHGVRTKLIEHSTQRAVELGKKQLFFR